MHLSIPLHVWLATLLIVMPIPEAWIKVGVAIVVILILALVGG